MFLCDGAEIFAAQTQKAVALRHGLLTDIRFDQFPRTTVLRPGPETRSVIPVVFVW